VELVAADVLAEHGEIPAEAARAMRQGARFELKRIAEIEAEVKHDVVAFTTAVAENLGPESRYLHYGLTSNDVVDTAQALQVQSASQLIIEGIRRLGDVLQRRALEFKDTVMVGRTHGVHAEPITFGLKCAGWRHELERNIARLEDTREQVAYGKISGPVGVHASVSHVMEAKICAGLGLKHEPVSTQIINRDRHALFMNTLALTGAGLERIATELRNLQRTEILEVQEGFEKGQTGSSSMPHKRNPWSSETVVGLARLLRSNAHAMLETVATWHERDLTNSSLERVVLPDSCCLLDFMLNRLTSVLEKLEVNKENMARNLRQMGDLVYSEHLMSALIKSGMGRQDAYKIAQRNAAKAWDGEDYKTCVMADEEVKGRLSQEELQEVFSLEHHLRNANG
ncbi:MAG: adenylosuccinate lyase, partial [Armatimonadetes bacterium]|nr:adenylosuccinate lyase [Armatimonadota bacterium]